MTIHNYDKYTFHSGDLIRWKWHGPGEGRICKIKTVIQDKDTFEGKFTVEDDLYPDYDYDISMIRPATYEEVNQCVPQIKFCNDK